MLRAQVGMARGADWTIGMRDFPFDGTLAGYHHMGGTRASERAAEGVVDRDLKIFDTTNAYVLGSSVFPNGGYANPTVTIVQLALRLGDHLTEQLAAK